MPSAGLNIAITLLLFHAVSVESHFGLNVGALFVAGGNKYIIDSSLPDTSSFTLVDLLHGIALVFIAIVIASTIYSLKLVKENQIKSANKFDKIVARVLFVAYLALNVCFISQAKT